ncbi:PEP/pyruvate-binding domain-containing protein [Methanobrevibacter sp. OttesenSCG-928-I08]|nr:PEP/pyruvate-binding domain-containing protein [Methanobrevibacter sp. OttesenSCG-928-I08]
MNKGNGKMPINNKVSTGITGLDQAIDMLRLGDNVVWQVQSIEEYSQVVRFFIDKSKKEGRRLVYFRFGSHEPLMDEDEPSVTYKIDASKGFENFATKIHNIIKKEGFKTFYVFDCLSDLLEFWYSDLMIGNFFRVACPFLYKLDTVAYFSIIRGVHTHSTIANIRETTQVLLDIYCLDKKIYIHPLKVWGRYSPTMFFPHLIKGDEAISITSSAQTASLLSNIEINTQARDYWEINLEQAKMLLKKSVEKQEEMKQLLISLIIGKDSRIAKLFTKYFTLQDILNIASREIGTGFIGGKSVGMLLGKKILEKDLNDNLQNYCEEHDSFYLGSDIFYTYILYNDWWELYYEQKTPEGYFSLANELHEKFLNGKFPDLIREQFYQMLEYFGQSPIIVRSSSLLEDNFGNAFAGKYESVFCANQGSPEERFKAFENAVRTVYASTMNKDAITYRKERGLAKKDEQMAILVQRVSGDHYDELFFPHLAGVGHSTNLYVWDKEMDSDAGMLRLVFGLGTRAVDRISGDYAHIIPLDNPTKMPPVVHGDERKFSQHKVDVLNLLENKMDEVPVDSFYNMDLRTNNELFFSPDFPTLQRLQELNRPINQIPQILNFKKLIKDTNFPKFMTNVLSTLKKAYNYPLDIEFTTNFDLEGNYKFNLVQCRPLQTKGPGKVVNIPESSEKNIFFSSIGNFMGGNVRIPLDYVIFVKAQEYLALSEREKYTIARIIGILNDNLKDKNTMLIGPGRWGTTTPSLGVPVHFSELCNIKALCEVSYNQGGLVPELSFGSHFFQDIVESDIFYVAIFDGEKDVTFCADYILKLDNLLGKLLPEEKKWSKIIHVVKTSNLTLYSDIKSQKVFCG